MEAYKEEFIKFMVECDVLKFGSFTLKSGRQSPFFMNAGAYSSGSQLGRLGEFYAKAYFEKVEGAPVKKFKVPMRIDQILRKFILEGGFDI